MPKTMTIKQMSRLTGVRARTLQFWTMSGVIECYPETRHEGPGKPRRYSEDEAAITLILGQISKLPLQPSAFGDIAGRLRKIIAFGPKNGITDPYYFRFGGLVPAGAQIGELLDGNDMYEQASNLKDEGKTEEADKIYYKYEELTRWSDFEFARRAPRTIKVGKGKYREVGKNLVLALGFDDVGHWILDIQPAEIYRETDALTYLAEEDVESVLWSLRLLLNLSSTLAPLREIIDEQSS